MKYHKSTLPRALVGLSLLVLCFTPVVAWIPSEADKECASDSDCNSPYESCASAKCTHKDVFPLYALEYVGVLVSTTILIIANAGGLGGGSIVLPMVIFFF